jgi:hypothetical protein
MSTLKSNGCRFMVSPDGKHGDWVHPAEIAGRCPTWTDCTDMDDADFGVFMDERRAKFPPLAA